MGNKVLMSDDKEISRQEALNATLEMPSHCKMSMTEAEASVDRFRARHWLRFDRDQESIHLAPRFLAEMEPYLLNLHAKESRPSKRNQNGRSKSRTSSQKRRENENELKRKRFNR